MTDTPTSAAIAIAFSGHDFTATYDHLAEEIIWENIGGETYTGAAAVRKACDEALEYFKTIKTEFKRLEASAGEGTVIVESMADYIESDGMVSTVASCDVYTFAEGKVVMIRSYNIDLG